MIQIFINPYKTLHEKSTEFDFEEGLPQYQDLEKFGSMNAAKEAGKMRLEGKEYIVQDGDICYFRFNV